MCPVAGVGSNDHAKIVPEYIFWAAIFAGFVIRGVATNSQLKKVPVCERVSAPRQEPRAPATIPRASASEPPVLLAEFRAIFRVSVWLLSPP
jgi:hypothetical protein